MENSGNQVTGSDKRLMPVRFRQESLNRCAQIGRFVLLRNTNGKLQKIRKSQEWGRLTIETSKKEAIKYIFQLWPIREHRNAPIV